MLARVLEPEVMDSEEDAREYDSMDHVVVNMQFATDLLAQFNFASSSRILDLGTGTAQIPIEVARRNLNITIVAVDAAMSMIALACRNVARAGFTERIEPIFCDAKHLPFDAATFPVVFSNSILHHVADPARVIAESIRVATPGGLQFHRDLCRPADEAELKRLVVAYAGDATLYQRKLFSDSLRAALTLEEMRALVVAFGFPRDSVAMTSDRHWTWVS